MSILLLFLAPLITEDGVNVGNLHRDCTNKAALSVLQSSRTSDQVADYAMSKCRHLEPQLKKALDASWRRDRSGRISSPPSSVSQQMTNAAWDDLLEAKRARLIKEIGRAREHFSK